MKIVPNYLSINNNMPLKTQKTSFGNVTVPQNETSTGEIKNVTPDYNVSTPMAYTYVEDIKLPGNLTAHCYKLANGQRVVIVPKEGKTVVQTYVNTGSLNENDNIRGISHYIEHNLFNGSEALGDKVFFDEVNKMGAGTNASTSFSVTDYFIESQLLEDTDLENQIKLQAAMVQTPKFLQDKLDKEKKIVDSEINMYLSDDGEKAQTLTLKNLFNIKSKSPSLVAGSTDNIDALTRDDVVNYFNNNYYPANMVTVITGETTPDEAMKLVSKYFTATKTPQKERYHEKMVPLDKSIRQDLISSKNEGAAQVYLAFAGPENANSKDKIYLRAVNQLLLGLANSRVHEIEKKYSTSIFSGNERLGTRPEDKTAITLVSSLSEKNVEPMLKDLYSAISSLSVYPPSEAEFNAIKSKIKKNNLETMESSNAVNYHIGMNLLNGDPHQMSNYNNILDNMTYQDSINTAKKYYDLNKVALTVVHPKGTKPEDLQNSYAQTKSAPSQIQFCGKLDKAPIDTSKISEYKTFNNFNVILQDSDSDLMAYKIKLISNKTICDNPVAKDVLNDMLSYCSTAYRSNEEMNSIMDMNSIGFAPSADYDALTGTLNITSDKAQMGVELLKENLLYPKFTQELFNESVQRVLDRYNNSKPSAYDKYQERIYQNTPIGMSKEEKIKQLSKIQLNDVIDLYNKFITQTQGQVVVTGPFSKHPELKNLIFNNVMSYHKVQPKDITTPNIYEPADKTDVYTKAANYNQAQILEGYKFKASKNA